MAEVVRYVDPDASGLGNGSSWTNAYTSLSAWDTGEITNLVTDGDWHHVYVRASAGTADTSNLYITGWTTGAANYILIEAEDGDQAVASGIDTNRYRMTGNIRTSTEYVRLQGLQAPTASANGFYVDFTTTASDIRVDDCYFYGANSSYAGIVTPSSFTGSLTVRNTICFDWYDGIRLAGGTGYFYNYIGCYGSDGIELDGTAVATITNCASFANSDDFDIAGTATATISYCASDDGDGTNAVAPSGSNWDNEFTDPANGDFTLAGGGNVESAGIAISGLTLDMAGETWDDPPSIGVLEIVSGGTTYNDTVAETANFADTSAGALLISAVVAETAGFGDSTTPSLDLSALIAETLILSDTASSTMLLNITISEGVILSDDAFADGQIIDETITESFTLQDAAKLNAIVTGAIAESMVLSDTSAVSISLNLTVDEDLSLSEQLVLTAVYNNIISEQLALVDAVSGGDVIDGKLFVTITGKSGAITIGGKSAGISVSYKSGSIAITGE